MTAPLACFVECSSIGAICLLTVLVVVTRIGVLKQDETADPAGRTAVPKHRAGPMAGTATLMFLVGCLIATALTTIVSVLFPFE